MPSSDNAKFTEFLFSLYSLSELGKMYSVIEDKIYPAPPERALFTILCDSFKLGLRDREQVAGTLQAVLLNWPENEKVHLAYLLFLIIAKHISSPLFQKLADNLLMGVSEFHEALANKILINAKFNTLSISGDNAIASQLKVCRVVDMLFSYHSYQHKTCTELWQGEFNAIKFPDKIGHAICLDCPTNYRGTPSPPISDYARRVSQSGQLKVS